MKVTPRILAESQLNPLNKEVVVVEGYEPSEVLQYLPNSLLVVQNTAKEYETVFSCESDVLNTLKPSIFICEELTPEQEGLCSVLGTVVMSLDDLQQSLKLVERFESNPDLCQVFKRNETEVVDEKLDDVKNIETKTNPDPFNALLGNSFKLN